MVRNRNEHELDAISELVREIEGDGPTWRFDGKEFALWQERIRNIIRRAYPVEEQIQRLKELNKASDYRHTIPVHQWGEPDRGDAVFQADFQKNLPRLTAYACALLDDIKQRRVSRGHTIPLSLPKSLKVFIAHGGQSTALDKLERFIRAIGAEPVIVEQSPGSSKSPSTKVDAQLSECDFAIILATRSHGAEQDCKVFPRVNVIDEMPRVRQALDQRCILLLQHGVSLPSNQSDWTWTRFAPQSMDKAFTAIANELSSHRLLTVGSAEDKNE